MSRCRVGLKEGKGCPGKGETVLQALLMLEAGKASEQTKCPGSPIPGVVGSSPRVGSESPHVDEPCVDHELDVVKPKLRGECGGGGGGGGEEPRDRGAGGSRSPSGIIPRESSQAF